MEASLEMPAFVLTMPAIYEFRENDDSKNGKIYDLYPWMRWSWCSADDVAIGLHYRFHPQNWELAGEDKLFDAFPWSPEAPNLLGEFKPLQILQMGQRGHLDHKLRTLEEYRREGRRHNGTPYVPAGWAKAVIKACAAGARKVELLSVGHTKLLVYTRADGQHIEFRP